MRLIFLFPLLVCLDVTGMGANVSGGVGGGELPLTARPLLRLGGRAVIAVGAEETGKTETGVFLSLDGALLALALATTGATKGVGGG